MKIAIMGAGSLGTVLGAYITKNGCPIDLIDSNEAHVKALNTHGARIIGKKKFTVKVNALLPTQINGTYDLVFLLVKQTFNDIALNQLKKHLTKDSTVCTLQNGLPEYSVAKILGEKMVVGGVVSWGAKLIEPGVSEITTDLPSHQFDIGEINGEVTERIVKIKEILQLMCPTNILDNLMGIRWNKIIANSAMSGMSAVLGCNFGEILDNPQALLRAKYIANECIHVCRATGIHMAVRHGYDHGNLLFFEKKDELEAKDWLFKQIWEPHRNVIGSMLRDLEIGIKTEIDYINGAVVEVGEKFNVPTPVNSQVVKIIKDIEKGKLKSQMANTELIELPRIN